jgi:hypothetical protein
MNLKLVVASMSVLGLVSCPVLAGTASKHKHKHHHQTQTVSNDYKDYKDMAPACVITQNMMTFAEMSQSMNRSMPNPCNPGWWNRIQVSGGINVDVGKFGNRNANYMGENYQRFSLNDAYINVMADVNEWSKAFASISYNTATINANPSVFNSFGAAEYDAAYSNNINGSNNSALQLEQGYVFIGNFDMSPVFLQVGKSFQDFSRYEIHPITASLTQVMSETLATSLKLGFIANGFNGSAFVFDDPLSKVGSNSQKTTNYGLALGYDMPNDQLGWDIGAAYLYNMIGANDVAYSVVNFTGTGQYHNRVGAAALYGDVNSGPFSLNARYTAAVQRFNVNDMTKNGYADLTPLVPATVPVGGLGTGTQVVPAGSASGAKPWSAGITGAYGFDAWGKNQNVYLGYQASREAAGMNIPKSRWLVGYGLEMFKNTNFGLEWDHDMAYSASNGGSGNNTNLVSVRSSVKFG